MQGNAIWLRARVLNGKVDGKLLCAVEGCELRALEDQAERPGPAASSSSTQPLNIRAELMRAEAHGPNVRVRSDPGNPPEAERDEHHGTHLSLRSWCEQCEHCDARKM